MERLTLAAPFIRARWEARRIARALLARWGVTVTFCVACGVCAVAALGAADHYQRTQATLALRLAERTAAAATVAAMPALAPAQAATHGQAGARVRLRAFDDQLLAQADLPFAVQELLALGAAEGLTMQRGSYRRQDDVAGAFLRYRMTLPVKGPGPAIQRFIKAALRKQDNLALESVQFTRARIGASDIEARIQWVILAEPAGGLE